MKEEVKLNADVRRWAKDMTGELKKQFDVLDIKHVSRSPSKTSSKEALEHHVAVMRGLVKKVSFKFPRHMVFVSKGLGRDTPIALQGLTNRQAKDWFNGPIADGVEDLADIVAENQADITVNKLQIK